MNGTAEPARQKRRIRNSAVGFSLLALAFYLGCILMFVLRASHHH